MKKLAPVSDKAAASGSLLDLSPEQLDVLAAMMEALVPGTLAATPGWAEGWHACCGGIRAAANTIRDMGSETAAGPVDSSPVR